MPWHLERRGDVVLALLRSSPVNKMNPAFFDDVHDALDRLERDFAGLPLVLMGEGKTFSAGLDFEDVFPRFARRDLAEVGAWFQRFRATMLRLFTLPRRTVAAVNGNAFAGGLILALACDHRIAVRGNAKFALNELAVGIPMPATFTEMLRYAVGDASAAELVLGSGTYTVADARIHRLVHDVVDPEQLLDAALAAAAILPLSAQSAYAASKKALLAAVLERIHGPANELDKETLHAIIGEGALRLQAQAWERLKAAKAQK